MSSYRLRALTMCVALCSISGQAQAPTAASASDATPVLTVAEMARQTISCKPKGFTPGLLPTGTVVTVRVSVNEKGKTVGVNPAKRCPVGCGLLAGPILSVNKCKFRPYTVNGRATAYQGDVELIAP